MYEKSYHTKVIKKDPVKTKKEKQKKRAKKVLWSMIGVLVAVGCVIVIRLPVLQITKVTVEGTEVVDPSDLERFILEDRAGRYLYLFPKTSILLMPLHDLEKKVAEAFPRLKTVELNRVTSNTLSLVVAEYHATYLWCADPLMCYLVDHTGMVYSRAPYFSGTTYPKIFKGVLMPIPFSPLTQSERGVVETALLKLGGIGIEGAEFHFETSHTLRILFNHHGYLATLLIDPGRDITPALENFYSGIRTEPLAGLFANKTKRLLYIDLRYGDRVIYKFE